ncbi:LANO_0H18118g1_1 [Lachancea nothofagi CBS 11611]|uniref:LANO_0H18118g1_1 n=1 Tax=Lachancea nothofagi CBS 11611 TaxID=1266666 RepID=A0A1G4KN03_9SACH|nr:LANO_0H18118g1_1 [Lachancea nothofagi CBS 11611]
MLIPVRLLLLQHFFALLQLAVADLSVAKPIGGSEYSVSSNTVSIEVEWTDVGRSPELDTVTQYVFTLCTGSNSKIQAISTLATVPATEITGNRYTVSIDREAGASGSYFLQVVAVSPEWIAIHYSNRFTITGMQGNKPAPSVNDPQGPSPETMKIGPNGGPPPIDSASFSIPYASQTGSYRFAPMQTQPGSVVTATAWTRQNPTSTCSFYATNTATPEWYTTITAGWDYTILTRMNDVHPRPLPEHNGGWYKPAEKMTLTTRKVNRYQQ